MKNILIISAMEDELHPLLKSFNDLKEIENNIWNTKINDKDIYFSISEIGKVNISSQLAYLIAKYNIEYVINIGLAGALTKKFKSLDIVMADEVAYHDVDLTKFNYKIGQVPNQPQFFKTSNLFDWVNKSKFLSGDKFINQKEMKIVKSNFPNGQVIDMESAAIGHVANKFNIKWDILRIISDSGSNKEYLKNKNMACKKLALKINEIIGTL